MMHDDNFRSRSHAIRQSARAHLVDIRRARLAKRHGRLDADPAQVDHVIPANAAALADIVSVEPEATTQPSEPKAQTDSIALPMSEQTEADDLQESAVQTAMAAPPAKADSFDDIPDLTAQRSWAATDTKAAAQPKDLPVAPAVSLADIYDDLAIQSAANAELAEAVQWETQSVVEPIVQPNIPADRAPVPDLHLDVPQPMEQQGGAGDPDPVDMAPSLVLQTGDLNRLPGAGPGLIWMLQQCGITTIHELSLADADDLRSKLGLIGQILNIQTWLDYAKAEILQKE